MTDSPIPSDHPSILDTHIHLYLPKHYTHLNWLTPSNEVLYGPHSIPQYVSCIPPALLSSRPNTTPIHRGFVFVETDRCYSDPASESDLENAWEWVLEEYSFVHSLSKSHPYGALVRGSVPWGPLHLGPDLLEKYYQKLVSIGGVVEITGPNGKKVLDKKRSLLKGFRYLLQDKPPGTMLTENFIHSLQWLGQKGLIFELGIDVHSTGIWQLEEAATMIQKVNGPPHSPAPTQTTFVINHLSKPPLEHTHPSSLPGDPYTKHLTTLASYPNTYIKLSGIFSELPPSTDLPYENIVSRIKPWVESVLQIFSRNRVIWGSDWPVCNVGFFNNYQQKGTREEEEVRGQQAWKAWHGVTTELLEEMGLSKEEKRRVWGANAAVVYSVELEGEAGPEVCI